MTFSALFDNVVCEFMEEAGVGFLTWCFYRVRPFINNLKSKFILMETNMQKSIITVKKFATNNKGKLAQIILTLFVSSMVLLFSAGNVI